MAYRRHPLDWCFRPGCTRAGVVVDHLAQGIQHIAVRPVRWAPEGQGYWLLPRRRSHRPRHFPGLPTRPATEGFVKQLLPQGKQGATNTKRLLVGECLDWGKHICANYDDAGGIRHPLWLADRGLR